VLSATLLDGSPLDLSSPLQDAIAAAAVDIGRCQVVQALVIAAVIKAVPYERVYGSYHIQNVNALCLNPICAEPRCT